MRGGLGTKADRQLSKVRAFRARPRGGLELIITVPITIAAPVAPIYSLITGEAWWLSAVLLIAALSYWSPTRRWRRWLRTFEGEKAGNGWYECPLTLSERGVPIRYRTLNDAHANERLVLALPQAVTVAPKQPPLLDPTFDAHLGVSADAVRRALIGPHLRVKLPGWYADNLLAIDGDEVRIRIEPSSTVADEPAVRAALDAIDAFVARLHEPPLAALTRIARDVDHPFDAARALAVLHAGWREQAVRLAVELAQTPAGAVLGDFVVSGTALADLFVPWRQRSALARAVLGVDCEARQHLLAVLPAARPLDVPMAIALVEICEAAALVALLVDDAPRAASLALIEDEAGPEHLDWLRARARRDKAERPLLDRVSARLQRERAGLLSMGASPATGGLSETDAGRVSLADEGG